MKGRTRPDPARALDHDKLRGFFLGVLAGEALGLPAGDLERDAILRRWGRLVHVEPGAPPGPLWAALCAGAGGSDAEGAANAAPAGVASALVRAAGAALAHAPDPVASARAARETVAGESGEPGAGDAAALLGAVIAVAFASDPYRPLPARELLAALAGATAPDPRTRTSIDLLRVHCLAPPPPTDAAAAYVSTPHGVDAVLRAVHALLVRPRSLEEAVVYAVNLGGHASLQGALAGAAAGAHRGGAAVPERWLGSLADASHAGDLARAVGQRRRDILGR